MVHGRREIAPKEQIKALRHARDHYVELAERIHNDTESALDAAERQLREEDARRIAKAYDRSLSNNEARLSGMEGTHRSTTWFFGLRYRIGALVILALVCLLPFAYQYMPSRDGFSSRREIGTVAQNSAPAESAPPASIPPPAAMEQIPLPEKGPKSAEPNAPKPAAARTKPKDIVPPRAPLTNPATKKVVPRETANAEPAAAKQAAPKPPETAATAAPASVPTIPPALAQPALAQPALAQPAPAAPPPAPTEAPAPQVAAAIPPPAAIPPAAIRLEPIAETHTLPRYPQLSAQIGEAGTTRMSVAITPQGRASDCRITQSSGSDRLDSAACAHVTDNWRWKPFGRDSTAPAPRISVTMVWNLSNSNRRR